MEFRVLMKGSHLGKYFFSKGNRVMFNKSRFYVFSDSAVYSFGIEEHPKAFIKCLEDSNPLPEKYVVDGEL